MIKCRRLVVVGGQRDQAPWGCVSPRVVLRPLMSVMRYTPHHAHHGIDRG